MNQSPPNTSLRILLVDDDLFVREVLSDLISSTPGFELVGALCDGEAALSAMATDPVDIVLLDINMPGIDGITTAGDIRTKYPRSKVLMLTSFDDESTIRNALAQGAIGYLLKSARPEAIVDAIRAAATGTSVISRRALSEITASQAPFPTGVTLSEAETEVLRLLVEGKSNAEIATTLYLSQSAVKARLNTAATKLGTTSRVATAVRAMQLGLA